MCAQVLRKYLFWQFCCLFGISWGQSFNATQSITMIFEAHVPEERSWTKRNRVGWDMMRWGCGVCGQLGWCWRWETRKRRKIRKMRRMRGNILARTEGGADGEEKTDVAIDSSPISSNINIAKRIANRSNKCKGTKPCSPFVRLLHWGIQDEVQVVHFSKALNGAVQWRVQNGESSHSYSLKHLLIQAFKMIQVAEEFLRPVFWLRKFPQVFFAGFCRLHIPG